MHLPCMWKHMQTGKVAKRRPTPPAARASALLAWRRRWPVRPQPRAWRPLMRRSGLPGGRQAPGLPPAGPAAHRLRCHSLHAAVKHDVVSAATLSCAPCPAVWGPPGEAAEAEQSVRV